MEDKDESDTTNDNITNNDNATQYFINSKNDGSVKL
jgi:hypothetical protein